MSYPKSVYELLQLLLDHGGELPMGEVPEQWDNALAICTGDAPKLVELFALDGRPWLKLTSTGNAVHALYEETEREGVQDTTAELRDADKPDRKAAKRKRAATVQERMAAMLLEDPERIAWPASKWATTLGCSAPCVKQTNTWKKIMITRALQKADWANR